MGTQQAAGRSAHSPCVRSIAPGVSNFRAERGPTSSGAAAATSTTATASSQWETLFPIAAVLATGQLTPQNFSFLGLLGGLARQRGPQLAGKQDFVQLQVRSQTKSW